MTEKLVEATLTSFQDQSGITTKLCRNYTQQTIELQQKRGLTTSDRQKNQLRHNLSVPVQQHTRCGGHGDPESTS